MVLLAVLAVWLGGCGSSGVVTPSLPELSPAGARTVTGIVLNASTVEPVGGAVLRWGEREAVSGANGAFALPAVARLDQSLTIDAPGFQRRVLALGPTTDVLSIRLIPAGAGTVVSPPGPPNR
jgi:hypothetical protein